MSVYQSTCGSCIAHSGLTLSQELLQKPEPWTSFLSNYHCESSNQFLRLMTGNGVLALFKGKAMRNRSPAGGVFWLTEGLGMKLAIENFIQIRPNVAEYSGRRPFHVR